MNTTDLNNNTVIPPEEPQPSKTNQNMNTGLPPESGQQPTGSINSIATPPSPPEQNESNIIPQTNSKVVDFIIGLLGFSALDALLVYGAGFLSGLFSSGYSSVSGFSPIIAGLVALGLNIAGIVYFSKNRKFITFGIASIFILPLLFFGGCLVVVLVGGL